VRLIMAVDGVRHMNKTTLTPLRGMVLLVAFASIPLRVDGPTPDVSWLITMCERILDGETAYVDIFETTPPVPMLLYMPGVLFSRLMGIAPEAATFGVAYLAALLSLALSARILSSQVADGETSRWQVLLPAAFILFIIPSDAFAQREYFAAAFALPIVSVFGRHAQDAVWAPLPERIIAAMLGGVTIAIKPPLFALPGLAIAAYYWARTGSFSFLLSSGLLAAGVIGVAVTAASLAAFPEYLGEIATLVREVYVPVRSGFLAFVGDKACLGVLSCLALALLLMRRHRPPVMALLTLIAGAGFLVVYFIQGKYFPYHIFPSALFSGIAMWILICERLHSLQLGPSAKLVGAGAIYALAVIGVTGLFVMGFDDRRPVMSNLTWATGLDRPTALAISPDIATAFPLARRINAVWVDRIHSQWVARYTRYALRSGDLSEAETTKVRSYYKQDLTWTLQQIAAKKPDLIIQDVSPGYSWLVAELSSLAPNFLNGYDVIAAEDRVRVLRRRLEQSGMPAAAH